MPARQNLMRFLGVLLFGMFSTGQTDPTAHQLTPVRYSARVPAATDMDHYLYLPAVLNQWDTPRVNVPHFAVADIFPDRFDAMAIFWFGRVTPTENYADVRIGYTDTAIEVRLGIVDRLRWFDTTPSPGELETWEAVTLYLNQDGTKGFAPTAGAYGFVSQLSWAGTARSNSQTAYRGNGTGWTATIVPFTTGAPWRGDAPNNNIDDRGWEARFKIPFTSLGLSGPPSEGTQWGLGVVVHDRDNNAGTAFADQYWPETLNPHQPARWGELRFGQPTYAAPSTAMTHTVVIRDGLAGADVADAAVGGTVGNLCPGNAYHIWSVWGNPNYGSSVALNIQNQRDITDWPCFAKYYDNWSLANQG